MRRVITKNENGVVYKHIFKNEIGENEINIGDNIYFKIDNETFDFGKIIYISEQDDYAGEDATMFWEAIT